MNIFTKNIFPYLILVFLLTLFRQDMVKAQIISDSKNISLSGYWNGSTGGDPSNMLIEDHLLYLAAGNHLQLYDLTDSHAPQLVSDLYFSDGISGFSLSEGGDSLYVLNSGLSLINISDPSNPFVIKQANVGRTNIQSQDNNLIISNDYAFTGGDYSISIIDLTEPQSISKIASYRPESNIYSQIFVHEYGQLILATEGSGTRFIDFSNPLNPSVISEFKKEGKSINTTQATIQNNTAYLTLEPPLSGEDNTYNFFGLSVWDIFTPSNPIELSSLEFPESESNYHSYSMANTDGLIFLGEGDVYGGTGRIKVIDITDNESPVVLDKLSLPLIIEHLAVYRNTLMASDLNNIYMIDFSDPSNLVLVDTLDILNEVKEVLATEIVNKVAITALGNKGVEFIDISDPSNPKSIHSIKVSSLTSHLVVDDNLLFMNDGITIRLFDISDVNTPEELSLVEVDGDNIYAMDYNNNYLIVCAEELLILDYSDPIDHNIKASFPIEHGHCKDVSIKNNVLYALTENWWYGDYNTVEVIDLLNFERLITLSGDHLVNDDHSKIHAKDGDLFIVSDPGNQRIYKYDITNSSDPVYLESFSLDSVGIIDIEFDDDVMFIANQNFEDKAAGIWTYDYNFNPTQEYYTLTGFEEIQSLSIQGGNIYTSWGERGLYILDKESVLTSAEYENKITEPNSFNLSQNYPNPFNPITTIRYHLRNASNIKLTVYDVLGRELETLVNQKQGSGTHTATFSAQNYPSGIYFYRLDVGNQFEIGKMTLLK